MELNARWLYYLCQIANLNKSEWAYCLMFTVWLRVNTLLNSICNPRILIGNRLDRPNCLLGVMYPLIKCSREGVPLMPKYLLYIYFLYIGYTLYSYRFLQWHIPGWQCFFNDKSGRNQGVVSVALCTQSRYIFTNKTWALKHLHLFGTL